jgi:hypothetical protein
MTGVIVIMALLMPGVVCVLRAEGYLRWPVALLISFLYVIASPAILAITYPFFWPKL